MSGSIYQVFEKVQKAEALAQEQQDKREEEDAFSAAKTQTFFKPLINFWKDLDGVQGDGHVISVEVENNGAEVVLQLHTLPVDTDFFDGEGWLPHLEVALSANEDGVSGYISAEALQDPEIKGQQPSLLHSYYAKTRFFESDVFIEGSLGRYNVRLDHPKAIVEEIVEAVASIYPEAFNESLAPLVAELSDEMDEKIKEFDAKNPLPEKPQENKPTI